MNRGREDPKMSSKGRVGGREAGRKVKEREQALDEDASPTSPFLDVEA